MKNDIDYWLKSHAITRRFFVKISEKSREINNNIMMGKYMTQSNNFLYRDIGIHTALTEVISNILEEMREETKDDAE